MNTNDLILMLLATAIAATATSAVIHEDEGLTLRGVVWIVVTLIPSIAYLTSFLIK